LDEWEDVVEDGVDKISVSVDIASIEGVDDLQKYIDMKF